MTTRRDIIKGGAGLAAILAAGKAPAYVRSMWGARNALMASRRSPLPPGARWVEYLESTGTQYIDTGVYGDSDTVAEFSFAMTDSSRSDAGVFGSRKTYRDDCFCTLRVQTSNGAFWMHYGDEGKNANYISTVIGNTADWHTARLAKSWTIDNSSGTAGTFTFTTPTTLKLFAVDMSTSNRWYAKCRVCYLRIYANGVLVRDFRPIAIGTKGYMLDMVSGQYLPYGNAGTGDFVVGPDVVPVEYIESHGTEWIDSGVLLEINSRIECDFLLRQSATQAVFGQIIDSNTGIFFGTSSNSSVYCNKGTVPISPTLVLSANMDYSVVQQGNRIVVNGAEYSTAGATNLTASAFLFARRESNVVSRIINGYIRRWDVYADTSDPIHKFRPVRVGTEGAMMDTLTRRIYRNQGTGAFSYGADLPYPIGGN